MAKARFRAVGRGPFGWHRVGRGVDLAVALGLLLLMAIAGAVLQYRLGPSRELVGHASAIDGDSLRLAGEELRLEGLDAPEYRQRCRARDGREVACGRDAHRALAAMLAAGPVTCAISRPDRYGRGLAICRQGETEINAALVLQGQAVAYGGYRAEEERAKAAGHGLWALDFERPADWRRSHPR
ncbi:thermonuclease family protein [Bosea sp. TWI1241]|uniref:thermonuclease family protein n=1 Tax=Bosea sp. TWI1241 TaxID=3148904 RepID=UPI00320B4ACF